ncbi:phage tail protein [Azospirillum oleiclasticum]|uniref:Phage tail protein n=1 Tax=Azospirillum oleiclasticum TaxID=2735135 RepID=A0ABX2TFQ0_9PROT|nr:phage tail protein [Azospirillum oleiclasticum]NYZ23083.1 phage tail protein [Azospirillum oleiclasticum]
MALPPTFEPALAPLVGFTQKPRIKLLKAEFGDGYIQRAPDGINHIAYNYEFKWEGPVAKIDEIVSFLHARRAVDRFLYTPPGELVTRSFVCQAWERTKNGELASLSATFEQVFGP